MKKSFRIILILIGLMFFFFGIKSNYEKIQKGKDFSSVKGKFIGAKVFSSDEGNNTYELYYSYIVNGTEYNISTNYGTIVFPEIGEIKTIMYNPSNPNEAFLTGMGPSIFLLLLGCTFTFMTTAFWIKSSSSIKQKTKDFLFNGIMGLVFLFIGIGLYIYLSDGSDIVFDLNALLYAAGDKTIFIIPFLGFGAYVTIGNIISLFVNKSDNNKETKDIETIDNETTETEIIDNEVLIENVEKSEIYNAANEGLSKVTSIIKIMKIIILFIILGYIFKLIFIAGNTMTLVILLIFFIFGSAVFIYSILPFIRALLITKYSEKVECFDLTINKIKTIGSKIFKIVFIILVLVFLICFFFI